MGCTIGCKECDGGDKGPSNPNKKDRCGGGMKATNNDPKHRTFNRDVEAGSAMFNGYSEVPAEFAALMRSSGLDVLDV